MKKLILPVLVWKKIKQRIFPLVGSALLCFLTGCATPYCSEGLMGGYSDTQLAPDVFRVVFRGNGNTPAERAQDFALLRASVLTLRHGFTCFAIVDERNSATISSFTTPGYANTTAYGTGFSSGNIYLNPSYRGGYSGSYSGTSSAFANATTTYTPPQTYIFYKPETGLLIRAFQTKPDAIYTFDAAFLKKSLVNRYGLQEVVDVSSPRELSTPQISAPTQERPLLVVKGIIYNERNPSALVGTDIVHEGDKISGITVVKITQNSVEFEMNGKKWTQHVQE
jgi:hypothetical protein